MAKELQLAENDLHKQVRSLSLGQRMKGELLSAAEKPDTVYPHAVQKLLFYVIPVFLFSAFPTRVALHTATLVELIWGLGSPIFYLIVLRLLITLGRRRYQPADE